jgi:hypothetical protein
MGDAGGSHEPLRPPNIAQQHRFAQDHWALKGDADITRVLEDFTPNDACIKIFEDAKANTFQYIQEALPNSNPQVFGSFETGLFTP